MDQLTSSLGLQSTALDVIAIKKGHLVLRSLNHKLRQQIIRLLEQSPKLSVTEIYVKLRLEQSVASQHLAIMRKAGYLDTTRDGKNIYYSINKVKLQLLMDNINMIIDN
jgi:ArsR family transcriptional regulator, virulence genes transcriptional regulator